MFSLKNRVSLVTGAGSGIGAAIAETYAQAGAFVVVSDRDEKAGRQTLERIRTAGGEGEFVVCDVAQEADAVRAEERVAALKGRLDILVNNAGIGHVGTILQTTAADLDRLHAVNVRGVFNMSKAFIPGMLERRQGVIINLASTELFRG